MRIINSISIIFTFGIFSFTQETAIVTLTSSQDVLINSQNVKEDLEYLAFGTTIEQHKCRSLLKFEINDLPLGQLKDVTLSLTM